MMNGKYWDRAWSLVDGCTPCSPGCDHCWSAAMTHRFVRCVGFINAERMRGEPILTDDNGRFNGRIITRPERLSIPLKRRKPTVFSCWNDLFHEAVPHQLRHDAYRTMYECRERHIFLILTKRPWIMAHAGETAGPIDNIYHGLTICNQQEADEKIPVFLQVPGEKFLSIEPMLGPVDFTKHIFVYSPEHSAGHIYNAHVPGINAVILGGETGPGARPMHPDWVRSVRDQCQSAGMPFFFKQWGDWAPKSHGFHQQGKYKWGTHDGKKFWDLTTPWNGHDDDGSGEVVMIRVGHKAAGRLLDGKEHDDLPWRK